MTKRGVKSKEWKLINVRLPVEVIKALDLRVYDKASTRTVEAAKMIVLGLQVKDYLEKDKKYL